MDQPPPPSPNPSSSEMSVEEKFRIVTSVGEECIQEDELLNLLTKKPLPICYDGFEPSGRMHIAQGVMKIINVNKLTSAGCKVKIWIADWFAQLNNKMDGDLKKIQTVGQYMIEIWKAVGLNMQGDKVEFLWSSEEINSRAHEYWPLVMDIARRNKLPRIMRCCQIMGRSEQDELSAAQILYPCMQCADIFFLKADICQLGMDQRKVNVLAREYCDDIKRKNKPIILSHHMLPGLQQGQEKMSKSDPSSSIFMEDEEAEVNLKIKKAYCPPAVVKGNPCLEYIKFIVFPWFHEFKIERSADNGSDKTFTSFEELVGDYASGNLHPADLKPALSKAINKILQPVRDHFKNDPNAKELLKRVKCGTENIEEQADDNLIETSRRQRKSWSKEEDKILVNSWLNVSKDVPTGTDQKATTFWQRVMEYYNEFRGSGPRRTDIQCKAHWQKISASVAKFIGCYDQAKQLRKSEDSEIDVLMVSHAIFRSDRKKAFTCEHVWHMLKNEHKWKSYVRQSSSLDSDNSKRRKNNSKRRKINEHGEYSSSPNPDMPSNDDVEDENSIRTPCAVVAIRKENSVASQEREKHSEAERMEIMRLQMMEKEIEVKLEAERTKKFNMMIQLTSSGSLTREQKLIFDQLRHELFG